MSTIGHTFGAFFVDNILLLLDVATIRRVPVECKLILTTIIIICSLKTKTENRPAW